MGFGCKIVQENMTSLKWKHTESYWPHNAIKLLHPTATILMALCPTCKMCQILAMIWVIQRSSLKKKICVKSTGHFRTKSSIWYYFHETKRVWSGQSFQRQSDGSGKNKDNGTTKWALYVGHRGFGFLLMKKEKKRKTYRNRERKKEKKGKNENNNNNNNNNKKTHQIDEGIKSEMSLRKVLASSKFKPEHPRMSRETA